VCAPYDRAPLVEIRHPAGESSPKEATFKDPKRHRSDAPTRGHRESSAGVAMPPSLLESDQRRPIVSLAKRQGGERRVNCDEEERLLVESVSWVSEQRSSSTDSTSPSSAPAYGRMSDTAMWPTTTPSSVIGTWSPALYVCGGP
jgi:hypothetical protein